jgi:hypothetical protein
MAQDLIAFDILDIRENTNREIIHLAAFNTNNVVVMMPAMIMAQGIITLTFIPVNPDQYPLLDKKVQIAVDAGQP